MLLTTQAVPTWFCSCTEHVYPYFSSSIAICTCHILEQLLGWGWGAFPSFLSLSLSSTPLCSQLPSSPPPRQRPLHFTSVGLSGWKGKEEWLDLARSLVYPLWFSSYMACFGCTSSIWRLQQALFMAVLGASTTPASLGFSSAKDLSSNTLPNNLPSSMLPGSGLFSYLLAIGWGLNVGPMPKVRGHPSSSPINPFFPFRSR